MHEFWKYKLFCNLNLLCLFRVTLHLIMEEIWKNIRKLLHNFSVILLCHKYLIVMYLLYRSFQVVNNQEIRQILTFDELILILSSTQLRGQIRRGLPVFNHE